MVSKKKDQKLSNEDQKSVEEKLEQLTGHRMKSELHRRVSELEKKMKLDPYEIGRNFNLDGYSDFRDDKVFQKRLKELIKFGKSVSDAYSNGNRISHHQPLDTLSIYINGTKKEQKIAKEELIIFFQEEENTERGMKWALEPSEPVNMEPVRQWEKFRKAKALKEKNQDSPLIASPVKILFIFILVLILIVYFLK
jgi:hypothetical protein